MSVTQHIKLTLRADGFTDAQAKAILAIARAKRGLAPVSKWWGSEIELAIAKGWLESLMAQVGSIARVYRANFITITQ